MTNSGNYGNLAGKRRLARVKDIPNLPGYEWTSERYLRQVVFDSKDRTGSGGSTFRGNGLGPAILRVGRRVLLDLDLLDRWIESHREQE